MLTPRAHIMTTLALHFAPAIDTPHILISAMEHALSHTELYQFLRLTPPSLLQWLIREFDIKGEAYSTLHSTHMYRRPIPQYRNHY